MKNQYICGWDVHKNVGYIIKILWLFVTHRYLVIFREKKIYINNFVEMSHNYQIIVPRIREGRIRM